MVERRLGALLTGIVTARLLVACGGVSTAENGDGAGTGGVGGSGGTSTGGTGGTDTGGAGGSGAAGGSGGVGTPVPVLGCGGDSSVPRLAEGLELAQPVDYLGVYTYGNGTPVDAVGTVCGGASERAACEMEFAVETAGYVPPPFRPLSFPGGASTMTYVAITRDDVQVIAGNAALVPLLGKIDTPNEALLSFHVNGYPAGCQQLYEYDGGYYMIVNAVPQGCGPGYLTYRLQVTTEGAVSATGVGMMIHGCVGRRPRGLALSTPLGDSATGRYYARIAELEAAAVIAFERLLIELADAGAPLSLLRRVEDAQRDEVRHARVMSTLAARYGAAVSAPRVPPRRTPALLEMALENVAEGCVRETWGALCARYQSETAEGFADRQIWSAVADDEARHAELSWDLHSWFLTKLSPAERTEVEAAQRRAWDELVVELGADPDRDVQRLAGVPSRSMALELARDLAVQLRTFEAETHAA